MGNILAAEQPPWEGTVILQFSRNGHRTRTLQLLAHSAWTMLQFRTNVARLMEVDPALLILANGEGRRLRHEDYLLTVAQCGIAPGNLVKAEFVDWEGALYITDAEDYKLRFSVAVSAHYTVAQLLYALHCKTGLPAGAITLRYFRLQFEDGKEGAWDYVAHPAAPDAARRNALTLGELGIVQEATLRMSVAEGVPVPQTLWGQPPSSSSAAPPHTAPATAHAASPLARNSAAYADVEETGPQSLSSNVSLDGTITSKLLAAWHHQHATPAAPGSPHPSLRDVLGEHERQQQLQQLGQLVHLPAPSPLPRPASTTSVARPASLSPAPSSSPPPGSPGGGSAGGGNHARQPSNASGAGSGLEAGSGLGAGPEPPASGPAEEGAVGQAAAVEALQQPPSRRLSRAVKRVMTPGEARASSRDAALSHGAHARAPSSGAHARAPSNSTQGTTAPSTSNTPLPGSPTPSSPPPL